MQGEVFKSQIPFIQQLPPSAAVLDYECLRDGELRIRPEETFDMWYQNANPDERWLALTASLADEGGTPSMYDLSTQGEMLDKLRAHIDTRANTSEDINEDGLTEADAHLLFAAAQLADHEADSPFALVALCQDMDTWRDLRYTSNRQAYVIGRIVYGIGPNSTYGCSDDTEAVLTQLSSAYRRQAEEYARYGESYAPPDTLEQIELLLAELATSHEVLTKAGGRAAKTWPDPAKESTTGPDWSPAHARDLAVLIAGATASRDWLATIIDNIETAVDARRQVHPMDSSLVRIGPGTYQASRTPNDPTEVVLRERPRLARAARVHSNALTQQLRELTRRCEGEHGYATLVELLDCNFFDTLPTRPIDRANARLGALEALRNLVTERREATTVDKRQLSELHYRIEHQAEALTTALVSTELPLPRQITRLQNIVVDRLLGRVPLHSLPAEYVPQLQEAASTLAGIAVRHTLEAARNSHQHPVAFSNELDRFIDGLNSEE